MKKVLHIFLLFLLTSVLFPQSANAQQNGNIVVTPSILHVDLSEDGPEAILIYKNSTENEVELTISAQDFTPLEDARKLQYLDPKESANYKYSLSSWIQFENKSIVLAPKEEKKLKILIDSGNLTPGGHYATVQAEVKQISEGKQISIKGILSSLLFVRTATGKEVEAAEIKEFKKIGADLEKYSLRFNNSGNVDLTPFGTIELSNPAGQIIGKGILNDGSLQTLPESIRTYDINVQLNKKLLLPGYYKAELRVRYGKSETQITKTLKFFSLGDVRLLILSAIGMIGTVAGGIVFLKKTKRKKIIKLSEK
jgi:hypothetical protein